MLQEDLARYKDIYQYVYSHVFPEVYTTSEKRGFDLKSNFHIIFKAYRDKITMKQLQPAKQTTNYLIQNHEKFEFERKPIKKFDEFSDTEESELKNKAHIQSDLKRERAEKKRAEKRQLKLEDEKVKGSEMWEILNTLNREFKKIKQTKKTRRRFQVQFQINKL